MFPHKNNKFQYRRQLQKSVSSVQHAEPRLGLPRLRSDLVVPGEPQHGLGLSARDGGEGGRLQLRDVRLHVEHARRRRWRWWWWRRPTGRSPTAAATRHRSCRPRRRRRNVRAGVSLVITGNHLTSQSHPRHHWQSPDCHSHPVISGNHLTVTESPSSSLAIT